MFVICVESSHQKGMGHLFRCLNLLEYLKLIHEPYLVLINNHEPSVNILTEKRIIFIIVDITDRESDWESKLIKEYQVDIWLNDRLETNIQHAINVKKNNILLVTFDDRGSGAGLSDLHFAPLHFKKTTQLKGRKVFTGIDYLILNTEIEYYKRLRSGVNNIIVSLGGSDTHGVTLKVVQILKEIGQGATVHIGPSFEHREELEKLIDENFQVIERVPSLIQLFSRYDLAVTGGGITPFEANASGLPCFVIANEPFEISNGRFLDLNGSSSFVCYHRDLNISIFTDILKSKRIDIESMSRQGLRSIPTNGVERVYRQIKYDF